MGEEWGSMLMSMDKAKIKLYIPADLHGSSSFALKLCSKVQRLGHGDLWMPLWQGQEVKNAVPLLDR